MSDGLKQITDDLTVGEALDRFYGGESIGDEATTKTINYVKMGPFQVPFLNLSQRKKQIYVHDVNHLLTGYDTTWAGEGEVAAYELASGFPGKFWVGYIYAPLALIGGLFASPNRVFRAFQRGRGQKNSTHADLSKEEIFNMRLGDLKEKLNIPDLVVD